MTIFEQIRDSISVTDYLRGKGYEIKEEVDEFGGECDCRRTSCEVCYKPWDVKKDIKL